MPFKLTIEQGKGRGQVLEFEGDEVTIGREESCDVVLFETGVSRQHARIAFDGANYVLSDTGSSNGTTINGTRIESEPLENGDRIGVGGAVFSFEAQSTGASTRIVSLEQAERAAAAKAARPKASAPAPAPEAAPASSGPLANMNPKVLRIGGIALAALVVLGLVSSAMGGKKGSGLKSCPAVIDITKAGGFVLGRGVDSDCEAPKGGLRFTFDAQPNTRYIVHYAPFFVKQGELAVQINGKKVDDSPAAPARRSSRQTIVLPDDMLKSGKNELTLVPGKSSDDVWGVERIELEYVGLAEADAGKAQEHYRLGTKLYHDKNVAAPNLYNAWMEMRAARRSMEGLDQKPEIYRPTVDLIRDIERELDALCKQRLFAAEKDAKYAKYDAANESYRFILAAFPGDAHPCRQQAEANMYVE